MDFGTPARRASRDQPGFGLHNSWTGDPRTEAPWW
jgi:hypothetical protein